MAAYNSAIYMGRALSFAAVIVAGKLGMANSSGDIGVTMVGSILAQKIHLAFSPRTKIHPS